MRSSSKKILYYIAEAGFGSGSDTSAPGRAPDVFGPPDPAFDPFSKLKPKKSKSSTAAKPTSGGSTSKALIDTDVMGTMGPEKTAEITARLSSIPYRAALGAGGVMGVIGRPLSDVLTSPERAQKELRAQQSAVQSMTNVSNYYKNLGIPTPSMHPKQDLLTTLKGILTNL